MTRVSVIVPTYNRLARLKEVLAALEVQQYPLNEVEVIVVSDGSLDGTDQFLATHRTPLNLIAVRQGNAGPAAARNSGIERASGEYVLFIDDDVIPRPQLIAEHMRLHSAEPNVVVLGPMVSPPDFTMLPWVAWEQAMLEKQYTAMQSGKWEATARQFYTGNTSLARRHLIEVGGFDERFRRAEDVELAYRLQQQGVRFVFHPAAVGYHYAERSFSSWITTPYLYGRNDIIFSRERQSWILGAIREEFGYRNRLTRTLVWLCIGRSQFSAALVLLLRCLADVAHRCGAAPLSRASYSAIFNLRYYQGIADELGGRQLLFGKLGEAIIPAFLPEQ